MKYLTLLLTLVLIAPWTHAGSGRVMGEISWVGSISYDHDGSGGTPKEDYAEIQIDASSSSFDDDADGDTNLWSVECLVGYIQPIYVDLSTEKGKAAYSLAVSARTSVKSVAIDYTEDGTTGDCIMDNLYM